MKERTTFTMTNGDKHSVEVTNPTTRRLFENANFDQTPYFTIRTTAGRSVTLNPKYVISIDIEES